VTFSVGPIKEVMSMRDIPSVAGRQASAEIQSQRQSTKAERKTDGRSPAEVIAIAASTGGPRALHQIFSALPVDFRIPILIVQHIASGFGEGLARQLDVGCGLRVRLAGDGETVRPGVVLVAPDDLHMVVDTTRRVRLTQGKPLNGHRPSATVLFESVAHAYGPAAMALILTGMGCDGAKGMQTLREMGATTLAQAEAGCMVPEMPKEAIARGAIARVVPLELMAQTVMALCGA